MTNKTIKLVNVVQVMLYDTTHEDVWRVLFKVAEMPPSLTEDRGLCAKRRTNLISFYISQGIYLPRFSHMQDLSFYVINSTG